MEKSEKKGLKISGQKLMVVLCILATELCERLTYYSCLANMVLFCTTTLEMTNNDASSVSLVFSGKMLTLLQNGCVVPTDDAYSSGHLVLSHLILASVIWLSCKILNLLQKWMWHAERGRLLLWTPGPAPYETCVCSMTQFCTSTLEMINNDASSVRCRLLR